MEISSQAKAGANVEYEPVEVLTRHGYWMSTAFGSPVDGGVGNADGTSALHVACSAALRSGSRSYGPRRYPKEKPTPQAVLEQKRAELRPLLNALRFVESSNRLNCPDGDGGMSIGPLQISEEYHRDAWGPHTGPWTRCRDLSHAEETMVSYWLKYCPYAVETQDWEILAKTHNGGPRGTRIAKTAYYWSKVMRHLKEQQPELGIPSQASTVPPQRPRHMGRHRRRVHREAVLLPAPYLPPDCPAPSGSLSSSDTATLKGMQCACTHCGHSQPLPSPLASLPPPPAAAAATVAGMEKVAAGDASVPAVRLGERSLLLLPHGRSNEQGMAPGSDDAREVISSAFGCSDTHLDVSEVSDCEDHDLTVGAMTVTQHERVCQAAPIGVRASDHAPVRASERRGYRRPSLDRRRVRLLPHQTGSVTAVSGAVALAAMEGVRRNRAAKAQQAALKVAYPGKEAGAEEMGRGRSAGGSGSGGVAGSSGTCKCPGCPAFDHQLKQRVRKGRKEERGRERQLEEEELLADLAVAFQIGYLPTCHALEVEKAIEEGEEEEEADREEIEEEEEVISVEVDAIGGGAIGEMQGSSSTGWLLWDASTPLGVPSEELFERETPVMLPLASAGKPAEGEDDPLCEVIDLTGSSKPLTSMKAEEMEGSGGGSGVIVNLPVTKGGVRKEEGDAEKEWECAAHIDNSVEDHAQLIGDGAGECAAGESAAGESAAGESIVCERDAGESVVLEVHAGEIDAGESVAVASTSGDSIAVESVAGERAAGESIAVESVAGESTAGREMKVRQVNVVEEVLQVVIEGDDGGRERGCEEDRGLGDELTAIADTVDQGETESCGKVREVPLAWSPAGVEEKEDITEGTVCEHQSSGDEAEEQVSAWLCAAEEGGKEVDGSRRNASEEGGKEVDGSGKSGSEEGGREVDGSGKKASEEGGEEEQVVGASGELGSVLLSPRGEEQVVICEGEGERVEEHADSSEEERRDESVGVKAVDGEEAMKEREMEHVGEEEKQESMDSEEKEKENENESENESGSGSRNEDKDVEAGGLQDSDAGSHGGLSDWFLLTQVEEVGSEEGVHVWARVQEVSHEVGVQNWMADLPTNAPIDSGCVADRGSASSCMSGSSLLSEPVLVPLSHGNKIGIQGGNAKGAWSSGLTSLSHSLSPSLSSSPFERHGLLSRDVPWSVVDYRTRESLALSAQVRCSSAELTQFSRQDSDSAGCCHSDGAWRGESGTITGDAVVVCSEGMRLTHSQAREHRHERVVAWLLNVMGEEEANAAVAAGSECGGLEQCDERGGEDGLQVAGDAAREHLVVTGTTMEEDEVAAVPVAGPANIVHHHHPACKPQFVDSTILIEEGCVPSSPPLALPAAPSAPSLLAMPRSSSLSPSYPTLLSALSDLCLLWASLHTDLRVRSSTFLSLMPPAVVWDCSDASLGLLPAPPAMTEEVERLRECVEERREEGGGKREMEQRLAVLVHARERLGSEEREELYEEWGVARWKASRLRRVVLVKMWNDPMRCHLSAELVGLFLE